MGRKPKNGEGTAQLRKDGLPKTKNVLAKTKGECVDKLIHNLNASASLHCLP